ncbi:MAG: STAS domain-containing protein [Hahellaceae bacterium]|nr:STAS domain-containing protein [Hahellaceae bacterium]MCP5168389.1 STAS domain-containing protein [Hahellaceae bacterium]
MPVIVETNERGCLVTLQGDAVIRQAAEIKAALVDVLQAHDTIEIDLGQVERADTTTLQLLLAIKRLENKSVRLINHSSAVVHVAGIANLAEQIDLAEPFANASSTGGEHELF